ncbi:PIN domain-like protein [Fistulina hepatica ATCC 64428]|nr:PIN domain-like protein [Fistulina hepatica ATCC 64428]
MGVKSLWQLLSPVGRPVMLETLEGKILAIDSSIWIYQFQSTMRDKDGRALSNAHVLGFLRRIVKLLFYGIKPVFVFDGGAPTLKRSTLNERRHKKAGAAASHVRIAEKLLAAQLRREAVEHARKNIPVVFNKDTVYLEDIDERVPKTSTPAAPPPKFRDHDPYHLPDVDLTARFPQATRSTAPDPRLATEEELRTFIEEMKPDDIDYKVIGDLRTKSRQTSSERLQGMLRASRTPLDFSRQQIENLRQRNALTHQLLATTDSIGRAHIEIPVRIAGERNREYVLVRNNTEDGGWILGIRDADVEPPLVQEDGGDSDEDMEEVDMFVTHFSALYIGFLILTMYQSGVARRRPRLAGLSTGTKGTLFIRDNDETPVQSHPDADEDEDMAFALQASFDTSNYQRHSGYSDSVAGPSNAVPHSDSTITYPFASTSRASGTIGLSYLDEDANMPVLGRLETALSIGNANTRKTQTMKPLSASMSTHAAVKDMALALERSNVISDASTSTVPDNLVSDSVLPSSSSVPPTDVTATTMHSPVFGAPSVAVATTGEQEATSILTEEFGIKSLTPPTRSTSSRGRTPSHGREPSPEREPTPEREPAPERESTPTQSAPLVGVLSDDEDDLSEDTEAWDAAQEMDPHAEEGEFARFLSQVKGRELEDVRREIDDEINTLKQQRKAAIRDSEDISQQMISQIMIMLRLFGIPYITAPMEAEAQCAELVTLGLVDGVITDDSDVFLFGAQRVYKNMFNQSKTVECFLLSDLARELGLSRDVLIRLAYLLGSDYVEGLPGVGPVIAMELLADFPGENGLHKFKEWWKQVEFGKDKEENGSSKFRKKFKKKFKDLYLSNEWPNAAVRDAYYHPTVDQSEEPFKWALPDLDALRDFLNAELGWAQSKVDDLLLPVISRLGKRAQANAKNVQGNLNEFLDISSGSGTHAPRRRDAYASKRLQEVVSNFRKRKNVEAAEQDVEADGDEQTADSEGAVQERQPKKRKTAKNGKKAAVASGTTSRGGRRGHARRKTASQDLDDDSENKEDSEHDEDGSYSPANAATSFAGPENTKKLRPRRTAHV